MNGNVLDVSKNHERKLQEAQKSHQNSEEKFVIE